MLHTQARMPEKREHEVTALPYACHAMAERRGKRRKIAPVVGQFDPLDVPEERLRGIEFGRVRGQAFDYQPVALVGEVVAHPPAAMRGQPIPEQDDAAAAEMPFELPEKADQRWRAVRAVARLKEQTTAAPIPAEGHRRRHGQPLPVAKGVSQDRRFAARRPGAPDDGLGRESAFVLEDEPRALASRVFFTAGHRRRTHCRIARSSRSRARRAGRCNDQFSRRKRYHTWPG